MTGSCFITQATFALPGKGPSTVDYDMLVGADGVGSTVRAALQAKLPDMRVDISDSGREYKASPGPSCPCSLIVRQWYGQHRARCTARPSRQAR